MFQPLMIPQSPISVIDAIQNVYWGSSNTFSENVLFTSFGDHCSLPRCSFPDLFGGATYELEALGELPAVLVTKKSSPKFQGSFFTLQPPNQPSHRLVRQRFAG